MRKRTILLFFLGWAFGVVWLPHSVYAQLTFTLDYIPVDNSHGVIEVNLANGDLLEAYDLSVRIASGHARLVSGNEVFAEFPPPANPSDPSQYVYSITETDIRYSAGTIIFLGGEPIEGGFTEPVNSAGATTLIGQIGFQIDDFDAGNIVVELYTYPGGTIDNSDPYNPLPAGVLDGFMIVNPDISGDQKVNLLDFAILADHWLDRECDSCGGADVTGDNQVDWDDLMVLVDYWLYGVE